MENLTIMNDNLFSQNNEYNPDSPIFNNFKYQTKDFSENEFPISRINDLFQKGIITNGEHSFLIGKFHAFKPEKRISYFAVVSLVTASINWILMLKFTIEDEIYQLLSGENRLTAGSILAPLAVILFVVAYFEVKKLSNVKGLRIGIAGLTLAIAILMIVIPVKLIFWFS